MQYRENQIVNKYRSIFYCLCLLKPDCDYGSFESDSVHPNANDTVAFAGTFFKHVCFVLAV